MPPNKRQIQQRAIEIYMGEQIRADYGSNIPEITELKEGGYLQLAKEQLRASKIPEAPW